MGRYPFGISRVAAFVRRLLTKPEPEPDFFLDHVRGVIHVGANRGQERDLYDARGLRVLWIEPIPDVFSELATNIAGMPNQVALCRLITDVDDKEYDFNISNNDGLSSSILALGDHREVWPEVTFTKQIKLRSVTLSTLIATESRDWSAYDALVMDTQGSELLILKGAVAHLRQFKFIRTEVSDFPLYQGCCLLSDMDAMLRSQGFRRVSLRPFSSTPGLGSCFDAVYARRY